MTWLRDQVALVTGGGSGLGWAVVERFVEEGARVGVLELSAEKARSLRDRFGEAVTVVEGDVSLLADNEAAVSATVAAFGHLDTFVGNAALWDFGMALEAIPADSLTDAFDQLYGVNVKGYLLGAKACVRALRASEGSMIFTLSNAAFYPGGGGPLYTSAKHAVVGLVKQLAYELAPEIRVNGVAPGGMATDLRGPPALGLADHSFGSMVQEETMRAYNPLRIAARPRDYTGHYVLLASRDNNRTVTGSIHNCDTGVGVRGREQQAPREATTESDQG